MQTKEADTLVLEELGTIKIGDDFDIKSLFKGKSRTEKKDIAKDVLLGVKKHIEGILFRNNEIDFRVKKANAELAKLDPVKAIKKLKQEFSKNKKTIKTLSAVYMGALKMGEALSLLDKETIKALNSEG